MTGSSAVMAYLGRPVEKHTLLPPLPHAARNAALASSRLSATATSLCNQMDAVIDALRPRGSHIVITDLRARPILPVSPVTAGASTSVASACSPGTFTSGVTAWDPMVGDRRGGTDVNPGDGDCSR
jgi:hypothetical protein